MSNNDNKPGVPRDAPRSAPSHRDSPDRIPRRDTAPAGTPAQKSTSATYQQSALNPPEEPVPAPVAPPPRVASERPPGVDTISPPRTVGGQTARLKVKEPKAEAPPPTTQDGEKNAVKAVARGAKEARVSGETDVKMSEPDLAVQKGQPAGPAESRWPFAIALGAIAFAIGSLLPLPFRKQIVGSPGDAIGALGGPNPPSTAARIPLAPVSPQARSTGVAGQAPGGFPTPAAPSPSATPTDRPAAPGSSAAPSTSASGGKSPGKNGGKPGRIGDIF